MRPSLRSRRGRSTRRGSSFCGAAPNASTVRSFARIYLASLHTRGVTHCRIPDVEQEAEHSHCELEQAPDPLHAETLRKRRGREARDSNGRQGYACLGGAETQYRRPAARDPRAVLRSLAGAALLGTSRRLPSTRGLLPHRGSADRADRASGGRSRSGRPVRRRRNSLPRRQARASARGRPGVSTDGTRLRRVPAAGRARRGRRRGTGTRHVRARDPQGRLAAGGACTCRQAHGDRGDTFVSDELVEPIIDTPEIPPILAVLPLKETVVFPESMAPLAIGQERSIKLIDDVVAGERLLALVAVKNDETDSPGFDELYDVGTAAIVHKLIRVPDGTLRILVQGTERLRLERRVEEEPYLVGEFVPLPDELVESRAVEALTRNVQNQFARVIGLVPYLPEELQIAAANVEDPSALCHLVASTLRIKADEKQRLLELVNVEERLREVSKILSRELEVVELGTKIQSQVQSEMEKGQREFFLRQQLKAIQEELGEADIRGHRRTYIGAMPGTIIRSLRDAESLNPVLLIDEIDKLVADVPGDPASAMLEVLDPE